MTALPPTQPAYFDLAFLICEPAEVYHQKAKENLSSHQLGDFRRCPQHRSHAARLLSMPKSAKPPSCSS